MKTTSYVEVYGMQIAQAELIQTAKDIWKKSGKKVSDLKSLKLYLKPEDQMVYYVFNDDEEGSFPIINNQNDF
jgi:SUMO ligase MMS21 Smc5/6 complex component